ncbi:MAG: hypothetical protein KIG14_01270 [Candidatus Sacchiramonaceae bacterium]|nr:hypothetical protein [Candidatus Saccharimonadaceae bacterium]
MVFIALPALQRNQRDTQRKRDVDRVLAAVQSYRANNRGNVPRYLMGNEFKGTYLTFEGETFMDPDGSDYNFARLDFEQEPPSRKRESNGATYIWVSWGGKCSGSYAVDANGANRHAIMMILEGGGVYCVDA